MTSTNRQRRSRTERLRQSHLVLTDRDQEIIRTVYRFRFLTSNQLTRMFFSSKSKADRRLRELFDHGYLDRIDRPTMSGKAELIYALWKKGAELLCAEQGIPRANLNWKPSRNNIRPERLQHELDIVSFHLAMDRSVNATPGVSWLFWQNRQEIIGQKSWELSNVGQSKNGKLKLIPDSFFGLQTPKGKTIFFLEVDQGTEAPRVFREKLLAYQLAFERGLVQKVTALKAFRVLMVTPDERRLQALLKLAAVTRHPLLFWFADNGTLNRTDVLTGACWLTAQRPSQMVPLHS
jgi:predicted transcriptional regulator